MVTSFALTGQKMNPVLPDTWLTQNKAVVMEGDYLNLAPQHTKIKSNHLKASALVSCYVWDKTMVFCLEGRLASAWQSRTGTAPDTQRTDRMPDMTTGRIAFVQEV